MNDRRRTRERVGRLRVPALLAVTLAAILALAASGAGEARAQDEDAFRVARTRLVEHLRAQGIESEAVLAAMAEVPRHRFVPEGLRDHAYADRPLPIGHDQTISQPYVVALMTELARVEPGDRVLEIGTGSGYQAAILAELGAEVYTIEILEPLGQRARAALAETGYAGVRVRIGDGYLGWPEEAPFDAIVVTAAPEEVPPALVEQLRPGGRMVVPVGPQTTHQVLTLLEKTAEGEMVERAVIPVRFVPMIQQ